MPAAGRMRHRITIIGETLVDQSHGGQEVQEVTVIDQAPVEFGPLTARERLQGGVQYAEATHRARLHWQPGVKPAMRATVVDVTGATRAFEIVGPPANTFEEGDELELVLIERVE
jgi:head-tail adaptor